MNTGSNPIYTTAPARPAGALTPLFTYAPRSLLPSQAVQPQPTALTSQPTHGLPHAQLQPLPQSQVSPPPLSEIERIRALKNAVDVLKPTTSTLSATGTPFQSVRSYQPGESNLFMATSEESFEESLMAGGYGRYRTAGWERPDSGWLEAPKRDVSWLAQPIPGPPGPSNVVSTLETVAALPPTAKELKKRRRLESFSGGTTDTIPIERAKLRAVEVEGRGRVLLDTTMIATYVPELSPRKHHKGGKKKKSSLGPIVADSPLKEHMTALSWGETGEPEMIEAPRPNWPDSEFPWNLRTEERLEDARLEREERMRFIERFLDRDTDDEGDPEDEEDEPVVDQRPRNYFREQEEKRRAAAAAAAAAAPRKPISSSANNNPRIVFVPSPTTAAAVDPADARAALLSKKTAKTLARRRKADTPVAEEIEDEVRCICNGQDDGREVVQCDGCHTWYHLQCIGIGSVAELGDEDDPWFCPDCSDLGGGGGGPPDSSVIGIDEPDTQKTPTQRNVQQQRNQFQRSFAAPGWGSGADSSPSKTRVFEQPVVQTALDDSPVMR